MKSSPRFTIHLNGTQHRRYYWLPLLGSAPPGRHVCIPAFRQLCTLAPLPSLPIRRLGGLGEVCCLTQAITGWTSAITLIKLSTCGGKAAVCDGGGGRDRVWEPALVQWDLERHAVLPLLLHPSQCHLNPPSAAPAYEGRLLHVYRNPNGAGGQRRVLPDGGGGGCKTTAVWPVTVCKPVCGGLQWMAFASETRWEFNTNTNKYSYRLWARHDPTHAGCRGAMQADKCAQVYTQPVIRLQSHYINMKHTHTPV